jgi:hypothetical protein
MGQHLKAVLYSRTGFPDLLTPKEAADICKISEDRLMTLAKTRHAPCAVLDDDQYFFFKKDICEWVKANLLEINDGKRIQVELKILGDVAADPMGIPEALRPLSKKLKKVTFSESGPCVYFLIEKTEVVYVGQSVNLLSRVGSHVLDKKFDHVVYLSLPEEVLADIETALIKHLKPKFNRSQNCGTTDGWHHHNLRRIGLLQAELEVANGN